MSLITGIVPSPRHPGRFDLMVEGKSFAVLSLDAIERLRLAVGRRVEGLEEQIAAEANQLRVYDRAVGMLAVRARSSAELARLMVRKGEERALVDRAISRLLEQGLLDDARFAEWFARSKVVGASQSRRRVQQDLARKGVARAVSDAAIDAVFEEEEVDQRAIVEAAARKKLRSLTKVDAPTRRRRLYGFLARRGYDGEDIRHAMQAIGEELRGEEESPE